MTPRSTRCGRPRIPAVAPNRLGRIDAVLLSHDQHFDNLDRAGRALLADVPHVFTTTVGAERLGRGARGLQPWASADLVAPDGSRITVTGTPARHGPEGADRGPVIGFGLAFPDMPRVVYISGDTVWYDGVEEVSRRFPVSTAVLFLGAARVQAVGPAHLTFTAVEAVAAARAFAQATILPLHFEGWEHFSESRADVVDAFAHAGLSDRLRWLTPGRAEVLVAGTRDQETRR
jgi:L-ascorbate metabolism protein UlaG (beta-lactamase superfamily)